MTAVADEEKQAEQVRPGGRVGLHRGEHGLLDRLPDLGLGANRRPAAVSHRRPHL
jgi:hypothetical protein